MQNQENPRMKKRILLFLFHFMFLFPAIINAQMEIGYMITKKGEKIGLYKNNSSSKKPVYLHGGLFVGNVALSAQYIYYIDIDGNLERISQRKIKECSYGENRYINLPIYSVGMTRLHRVIAENENFLLTSYFHNSHFFYVFEKADLNPREKKVRMGRSKKRDLKLIESSVKPYFGNCPELLQRIKKGVLGSYYHRYRGSFNNTLFKNISNYKCGDKQS